MKKLLFVLLLLSFEVSASLMITPTRIAFADRQRVERVTIINNSDISKTYRLMFQQKLALKGGGYADFAQQDSNPMAASDFIRLSPRQVTLGPKERQVIKLAVRRTAAMPAGEYRSHLLFKELPRKKKQNQQGVNIDVLMSYSIPVILRVGQQAPRVDVADIAVLKPSPSKQIMSLTLNRLGKYSSFGTLSVDWLQQGMQEPVRIGVLNKFAIYPELTQRVVEFDVDPAIDLSAPGQVIVKYRGDSEYAEQLFLNQAISL